MKKPRQAARGSSRRASSGKSPKSDFSWLPAGVFVVGADGVTDARYFNPSNQRSIHVEKAVVTRKSDGPEFFMDLRDEDYPGSTDTLRYDEAIDSLAGIYYQATMRQRYEVAFKRTRGN